MAQIREATAGSRVYGQDTMKTASRIVGPAGSVADYVCDGTADDVEIQAAIDAVSVAGGGTVFLRAGTYNIAAQINLNSQSMAIEGEGLATKLNVTSAINALDIYAETASIVKPVFRNFQISGGSTSLYGIQMRRAGSYEVTMAYFENVFINGFGTQCYINTPLSGTFVNCAVENGNGSSVGFYSSGGNVYLIGCWFENLTLGCDLNASSDFVLVYPKFSSVTTNFTLTSGLGYTPTLNSYLLEKLYAQGNVTGATTFNRVNGDVITATLTGNITVTLTNGVVGGDTLTLILTQDATGSRTVTWPSNFKKAGGTLTLSTGASAVDVMKMRWDGTNWHEVARSLNNS